MEEPQKFTIALFQLPDGRVLLQRRTDDAPYAAGKLGLFGGWVEEDETPDQCIVREIKEETNLNPEELNLTLLKDFILPASADFDKDRHFYLYSAQVLNADFEVYEGKGAEAFTVDEIKHRSDLTGSAQNVFSEQLYSGRADLFQNFRCYD
jgi:8-oxo-dGTP pyrophosphatase MutT (NUDIX family)